MRWVKRPVSHLGEPKIRSVVGKVWDNSNGCYDKQKGKVKGIDL